jgi:hypothetical protein
LEALAPQRSSTKSQRGELLSDVGQNEAKIKRKQFSRASLDKVGLIEAQGFNPGKHPTKRFALKGREIRWAKCAPNATEKEIGIC